MSQEPLARQSAPKALLTVRGVEKSYGPTKVLRGVDFNVFSGEIHALLGGNGAGKSTLIKVIFGGTKPEGGEITKASARAEGVDPVIAVVHQELALLPELTVAENIGIVHAKSGFAISRAADMRQIALRALRLIDSRLAERIIDLPARRLSLHEGQIVEIARALSVGAEMLLLDEPTANLTAHETEALFAVLRRLAASESIGIVFVSHRMKEIRQLCDRCTIIRDGKTAVDGLPLSQLTDTEIVQQMGQPLERAATTKRGSRASIEGHALRLTGPKDMDLAINPGSILGLAGAPAGPTALIEVLVGASAKTAWSIHAPGMPAQFSSPAAAIRAGIGYVSGDRAIKGVLSQLPIIDNVLAARRVSGGRYFVGKGEERECKSLVESLSLKASSIWDLPRSLSGGNQQKLLVARWIGLPLKVIVFEEPTRGVDIGTKRDIYGLIRQMADTGSIVIWWSTENTELLEICDQILTFDPEGQPVGLLEKSRFTEERIAELTGMAA